MSDEWSDKNEELAREHLARLNQLQDQIMVDALVKIIEGCNATATITAWESIQWERIRYEGSGT